MKISVSSYSYNQYLRDGRMTQLSAVKKAAEMGFEGIEFTELTPCETPTKADKLDYARKIREETRKYGIEIVAYCVGANLYHESDKKNAAAVANVCDSVDIASELGAPIMRHDVCYGTRVNGRTVSFEYQLPTIAANARKIAEYAASKGVKTCTENHGLVSQDSDRVERLYNVVNHENYGLLVDIGNFACADEDSVTAVSRVAQYAIHVHAKDFYITRFGEKGKYEGGFQSRGCNTLLGSVIGEGDIPTAQCIAILKKAGYDGFVSIEYEGFEDCIEGLRRGLINLKKYI
ncbi:MAG: sugar phosphate isomerase/epimerase [Clostridia bacterium]|nr:sugar phosphate isomerase/epimerase [Clostridia bacterium]